MLNISHSHSHCHFRFFKLIAGVFFAGLVLTACGGSDAAAPAAATNEFDAVYCAADTQVVDGKCVGVFNDETCAADTRVVDGKCVGVFNAESCATGTKVVDGKCVPISCDAGSALVNTQCVVTETFNDAYCSADTIADETNKQCVFNAESCATGTKVVDNKCVPTECPTGTRIAADKVTCETIPCQADQFLDGNNCVTALTADDCAVGTQLNASTNSCVVITCAVNQTLVGNDCVANIDPLTCTSPQVVINNKCQIDAYTPKTYKYFDSRDANDDGIVTTAELTALASNEYSGSKALVGVNAAQAYVNIENLIDSNNHSGAVTADGTGITQGGKGQIVSLIYESGFKTTHQEFSDGALVAGAGDGAAFKSILNLRSDLADLTETDGVPGIDDNDRLYDTNAKIIAHGDKAGDNATSFASLIAGRKGNGSMHGIAFNAQLKGFLTPANNDTDTGNPTVYETRLWEIIPQAVGSNIIAMNYAVLDAGNRYTSCNSHGDDYVRPTGINVDTTSCLDTLQTNHMLSDAELTLWRDAVDPAGTNKTIMVFGNGGESANSENGRFQNVPATFILGSVPAANIPGFRAAYPAFYDEDDEATPDINEDLTADRWLAVVGLGERQDNGTPTNLLDDFYIEGDVILDIANGCGVAMRHCLAAPGTLSTAATNGSTTGYSPFTGSDYASATVAGGLAVLKGAFPNATPEQLTKLVLETASYIPLDNKTPTYECTANISDTYAICEIVEKDYVDVGGLGRSEDEIYRVEVNKIDGTKRYINPVYGYGKFNMAAATTPNISISYVTASNNQSIGALWQDTHLTLSSHFGNGLDDVKLGIGDAYGRHFISKANKTISKPVAAASFDEYMANMLGDNVQSEKLGGQAKLNYSNTAQPWMNLEYRSGKATSKIAFQDNYKVKPLHNNSAASILRANHIRPASNNIGMMDVDYALSGALSLSSYAARGEYDTGYKFDELGTDFDVNYKKSHLNIAIGNIREHDQFLGTHTTGGYALNAPTVSRFTDVTYGHDVGAKFNIYANYINYETDVDMLHDQFASIDGLQADQYQIGFTGKNLMSDDDSLNVALITKLGVTDGALNQNTTLGYTADGAFNDVSQSYDLAVSERHQQFEITYQGKIYQNADKVSTLKDNRFFTTIRVDQNLNHVQGASQTEIVSGVSARF